MRFLQKLTWKYGRPLVLKSPPHTARIRLLLELFPDARFVHIRRDPYAVFRVHPAHVPDERSSCTASSAPAGRPRRLDPRQYRAMYDAFFEERGLIPAGRLAEVGFEDLEADPSARSAASTRRLGLPDFGAAEPALRRYSTRSRATRRTPSRSFPPTCEVASRRNGDLVLKRGITQCRDDPSSPCESARFGKPAHQYFGKTTSGPEEAQCSPRRQVG